MRATVRARGRPGGAALVRSSRRVGLFGLTLPAGQRGLASWWNVGCSGRSAVNPTRWSVGRGESPGRVDPVILVPDPVAGRIASREDPSGRAIGQSPGRWPFAAVEG